LSSALSIIARTAFLKSSRLLISQVASDHYSLVCSVNHRLGRLGQWLERRRCKSSKAGEIEWRRSGHPIVFWIALAISLTSDNASLRGRATSRVDLTPFISPTT
jgi:hypothetical protein